MFASLIYTGNKSVNKFREVVFHEGLYGITKCRDRRVVLKLEDTAPVELYDTRTEAVEKEKRWRKRTVLRSLSSMTGRTTKKTNGLIKHLGRGVFKDSTINPPGCSNCFQENADHQIGRMLVQIPFFIGRKFHPQRLQHIAHIFVLFKCVKPFCSDLLFIQFLFQLRYRRFQDDHLRFIYIAFFFLPTHLSYDVTIYIGVNIHCCVLCALGYNIKWRTL